MKKTLVLASLLAAFGAASAQSSVTVYGQLDQGLGRDIVSSAAGVASAKMQLNPGTADIGGFRFGVRGTEALGNGLSAKFGIEATDSRGDNGSGKGANDSENNAAGAAGTFNLGARAAWVGLSGGFGELRFGRHATIGVLNAGTQTNFGWRGTNSQAKLGLRGGIDMQTATNGAASRTSAAVTFLSANYSGFSFAAQASLKDDNFYNGPTKRGYTSVAANYSAGPLTVQGYTSNAGGAKSNFVGASYNFGMALAGLSYTANTANTAGAVANKGITARVKGTFGAFQPGLEITKVTTGTKPTGVEFGTDYNLSPRTALTFLANKTTNYQSGYFAGVRHAF